MFVAAFVYFRPLLCLSLLHLAAYSCCRNSIPLFSFVACALTRTQQQQDWAGHWAHLFIWRPMNSRYICWNFMSCTKELTKPCTYFGWYIVIGSAVPDHNRASAFLVSIPGTDHIFGIQICIYWDHICKFIFSLHLIAIYCNTTHLATAIISFKLEYRCVLLAGAAPPFSHWCMTHKCATNRIRTRCAKLILSKWLPTFICL